MMLQEFIERGLQDRFVGGLAQLVGKKCPGLFELLHEGFAGEELNEELAFDVRSGSGRGGCWMHVGRVVARLQQWLSVCARTRRVGGFAASYIG